MGKTNNETFINECFKFTPAQQNIFARYCGTPLLKAPTEVLIEFFSIQNSCNSKDNLYWTEEMEAKFFIACLIGKYKITKQIENPVSLPELFGDIYNESNNEQSSKTQKEKIKFVLKTNLDKTARLFYLINNLIEQIPKDKILSLDFERLLTDLIWWNPRENPHRFEGQRNNWAYTIVNRCKKQNLEKGEL